MPYLDQHFGLSDRIALVTGANRGIGLAIARALGGAGATVLVNGRDAQRTEAAVAELAAGGIRAASVIADVTDAAAVQAAIARAEATHGAIDILVNNAGMQFRAPFAEFPADKFDLLMQTNVYSAFHVSQAVARSMIPRRTGSIINICSVQSELGRPTIVPYTATKGALKMMTRGLAAELGRHNIRVNGIAPGYFRTELNAALVNDPAFSNWVEARTPMARWGDPDELGGAAVFLASDASSFMTGQLLHIDGGMTASV